MDAVELSTGKHKRLAIRQNWPRWSSMWPPRVEEIEETNPPQPQAFLLLIALQQSKLCAALQPV
eukprot:22767-Rhodomonas_salina.1